MKTFSLTTIITSTSLIVGICSVLLFAYRQHVLEFALSLSSTTGSILQTINIIKSSSSTTTLPEDTPLSNVPTLAAAQQQEEEEEQTPTPTTITISSSPSSSSSSNMSSAAKRLILNPRVIRKAVLAVETPEGAGARVRRSIGTAALRNFTPFLMLDHFHASSEAGFPDHPHRGQETITYLIQGGLDHEDFAGNKGTLNSGDLQFMTAGRGIMHSEMPRQNADGTPNVGLQLWVDLPKELKYCEPRYRDLRAHEIPVVESDDGKVKVKVISGEHAGVESVKDLAYTPVVYYDVEVKPGGRVEQKIPEGFSAFVYILEGEVVFGQGGEGGEGGQEKKIGQYHNVVFGDEGDGIVARVEDSETSKPARFVIIGGKKLDQPVVQYGPFVLNSQDEVYQAFVDYQSHSNGFERAKGWRSEIGKRMIHH